MQQFLYQYDLNPTTWVYLSSLLIIAIYFKFSRFWSIRNLDLIGLLAIAPGILMLAYRSDQAPVASQDPGVPASNGQQGSEQTGGGQTGGNVSDALDTQTNSPTSESNKTAASDAINVHHLGFIVLFSVGF